MAFVKIRSVNGQHATMGSFLAPPSKLTRKLEPGEVVEIPDERAQQLVPLGRLEITLDPPTRPLVFDTPEEARLTSPSINTTDTNVLRKRDEVVARVRAKLAERIARAKAEQEAKAKAKIRAEIEAEDKAKAEPPRRGRGQG